MAASRNPLARLHHIRDEIDQLTAAMGEVEYGAFLDSYMHRRTAEHAVLIISEAVRAIPEEIMARYPGPNWRAMRGIGNVLGHDYFAIEAPVLWDILRTQLPQLRPVVARMIEDLAGDVA
jgi:uncharacterized protein with HEPN domain